MSSNRREDELLNKLKSCLGSTNSENINIKDLRAIKNTYCNIKQGHQNMPIAPKKYSPNEKSEANTYWIDRNAVKQPLRPSNLNSAGLSSGEPSQKAYHFLSTNRNSVQLKHQAYNGKYDIPSSLEQISKPGKRYEYGVKDVSQQPPNIYQEKSLLNRRLSHPHKELANQTNIFTTDVQNRELRDTKQKAQNNYKQEMEQRKNFVDYSINYQNKAQVITKNRQINTGNVSKEWPIPPVHYESIKRQAQRAISKQAVVIHQQVQRANPPSRSAKECVALAKLNRISQLNEKINDRIRSIISVFEEHKT